MTKTTAVWGAAGALGVLLFALTRKSAATVANVTPVGETREVTVSGRSYAVVALGGGRYSVTDLTNPTNNVVITQTGVALRTGNTTQLEADMKSFPSNLFST